jgi:hypothetical protein
MPTKTKTIGGLYVVARGVSDRPTSMHPVSSFSARETPCGQDLRPWSLAYTREPLTVLLCRQPACLVALAVRGVKARPKSSHRVR